MSAEPANGKATASLIIQALGVLLFVIAPLIIMYAKINTIETTLMERLGEVETQFRAADEFRNVNLASQMRFNSLLWQKAYGEQFPGEIYFPTITKK
jgi:predicted Holliday junction resolvase-like endonuclease